jgi:hypothetical protein
VVVVWWWSWWSWYQQWCWGGVDNYDDVDDNDVFVFTLKESLKSHTNTLKALIMTHQQLVADVKALLTTMAKVSYQIISNLNLWSDMFLWCRVFKSTILKLVIFVHIIQNPRLTKGFFVTRPLVLYQ